MENVLNRVACGVLAFVCVIFSTSFECCPMFSVVRCLRDFMRLAKNGGDDVTPTPGGPGGGGGVGLGAAEAGAAGGGAGGGRLPTRSPLPSPRGAGLGAGAGASRALESPRVPYAYNTNNI
jgi:hypothetical protein